MLCGAMIMCSVSLHGDLIRQVNCVSALQRAGLIRQVWSHQTGVGLIRQVLVSLDRYTSTYVLLLCYRC